MDPVKSGHYASLMRHLDELLAEAVRLREQITAAMRADDRPFWPERRVTRQPRRPTRPDRRGRG